MYYSNTGDADFTGGSIYVLRYKQISDGNGGVEDVVSGTTYNESSLDFQATYDVEFVEIPNGSALTKNEMETACLDVNASQFMRVEDVDYQKGSDANGRNVFFAVTGRGPDRGTYNDWGTVYKLELDPSNPLEGRLTQIISGNTDTNNQDGKQVLELVVRQDLADDNSTGLSGEFGALIDISDKIQIPNTFILNIQPHYWRNENFASLDGHTNSNFEDTQASQVVLLRGLPR